MSLSRDTAVIDTAEAINRYLAARPNASETVDGIAKWWLLRQRYEDSKTLVQSALDLLIHEGVVERSVMPDGKIMYCRAVDHRKQLSGQDFISSEEH